MQICSFTWENELGRTLSDDISSRLTNIDSGVLLCPSHIYSYFTFYRLVLKGVESLSSVQESEGVSVVVKCALTKGLLPSAQLTLALKTWKDAELS